MGGEGRCPIEEVEAKDRLDEVADIPKSEVFGWR